MLIYTCPKCGTDLDEIVITTYPPIYKRTCPKCGWSVEIRDPIIKQTYVDYPFTIANACMNCSNNPKNGGSGICHCILGNNVIY